MKNNFKKLLSILSKAVFVIFIIIAIIMGWTLIPIKNNIKILTVTSGSMAPEINTGSVIVVKPYSIYEKDDVITFQPPVERSARDYTTHRIIEVKSGDNGEKSYITKGDANNAKDVVPVFENDVIGKKILTIPAVGYIFRYVKTLPGLIIIIALATVVIYEEVNKIKKEIPKFSKKSNKKIKKTKKKKGRSDGRKT